MQTVSRADMVYWMSTHGSASVEALPCQNWGRVNIAIADQTSGQIHAQLSNFHLLELICAGQQHTVMRCDTEEGDRLEKTLMPGSIGYVQEGVENNQNGVGSARIQQVYIDGAVFRNVAHSIAKGDPDKLQPQAFQGVFDPHVKNLMMTLLDEARKGGPGGELCADLLAQQLAVAVLRRRLGTKEKKPKLHALSDSEVATVIAFMEENLDDPGGLDCLAETLKMDVFSFARGFKAKTGQAPHQFLIERRLMRVRDLLLHSNDRLVDITYATGFSNQAHMTTAFSKHFGMPPGAWRKKVRS